MHARRGVVVGLGMALALLLVGAASAQDPEDVIVVCFMPGYSSPCGNGGPYTVLTAYVMAVNISDASGISGWECALVTDPGTVPAGVTYTIANGGVNALSAPDFAVTLSPAVPRTTHMSLATWQTFYLGGVIKFGLGPAPSGHFPSEPGPGYAAGDDPSRWTRLHVSCAMSASPQADTYYVAEWGVGCPVIGDEWPCVVPAAETSWGGIKQLYQ